MRRFKAGVIATSLYRSRPRGPGHSGRRTISGRQPKTQRRRTSESQTRRRDRDFGALQLDRQLIRLVATVAPRSLGIFAMGPDTTSALLVTIGDNPDRLRSESAFARLCGVAPIPASSGKTNRHRLHRGGDRSANRALHIAVVVRMRYCPRTRAYIARRTSEGLSKPEIIRCLKRYLAREMFQALRADFAALTARLDL